MPRTWILLILLSVLVGCSSAPPGLRDQSSTLAPEEAKNDPEFFLAQALDSFLVGRSKVEMPTESLAKECLNNRNSSLCSTFKRINSLTKWRSQKEKVYRPNLIKPMVPISPVFAQGKISNWSTLRKTPIPNLLKGFLVLSKEQVKLVSQKALSEHRCPNNASVAAAATLEDYLPDDIPLELLASLYEKSGKCRTLPSADREHFLTRAGLFYFLQKNYSASAQVLSKVNPTDAYSGRAVYWLYRSRKELGDKEGATKALIRLNSQHRFSFHNLVASTQENTEPIPEVARNISFSRRSTKNKKINADIQSAETLLRLGFPDSCHLIVDWLLNSSAALEPELKLYLSYLGDDHTKVTQVPALLMFHPNLISKESIYLNYPNSYFVLFEKHRGSFSPYLLLAIARRESSFNPKAVSPANAQGLLQMNPETVKQLHPEKEFNLLDAETNVSLAADYLGRVFSEMGGYLPATLAAYNAGEAQSHNWKKRYPATDKILWIDLIPFRETRDYVANVLSTYHWYRKLYENRSDLKELLN